ncbi:MAG TPA: hypothetical protein VK742_19505 [Candidatus Sulfotelmatobacter sp.]|jgi:hypothetical protein|nr:hypothetical protein [Candidatus Sulfotelmatobacter sp.]
MKKLDATRLLYGPYRPPEIQPGGFLDCVVRGRVWVGSWSHGRIPWPREKKHASYILCGDLVRAIKQEGAAAVVHHWGVSDATVTTWRKQLGIDRMNNPGTHRLYSVNARQIFAGRPKTRAFKQFMRRYLTKRIRDGELHNIKPEQLWKSSEVKLLGTAADEEVARKLGRSVNSVKIKRTRLGITGVSKLWLSADEIELLGKQPDAELAARFGRTLKSIQYWRVKLGRTYYASGSRDWTAHELKLLGRYSDAELARRFKRTEKAIQTKRVEVGILRKSAKRWSAEEIELLGKISDEALARQTHRSLVSVQMKRRNLKIAPKIEIREGVQPA